MNSIDESTINANAAEDDTTNHIFDENIQNWAPNNSSIKGIITEKLLAIVFPCLETKNWNLKRI